jgi:hypothetical protein
VEQSFPPAHPVWNSQADSCGLLDGSNCSRSLDVVFALEAFNSSGSIDQALLTGIKGMASRAHFDMNFAQCGTGFERIAAGAGNHAAAVLWMDFSFHLRLPSIETVTPAQQQATGQP